VIGVENLAWECDYPHPDTTWPRSPENVMAQFAATGCTDDEIDKITWENACRFSRGQERMRCARPALP
jgi:hypothetical protein